MLSIDEVIARERQQAKEQRSRIGTWDDEYSKKCEVWAEEHEQIAEWLEELKANKVTSAEVYEQGYKRGYKNGYNNAIDEVLKLPEHNHYDIYKSISTKV